MSHATPEVIPRRHDDSWWRASVGYEVYIRSFRDTNADGVGDLAGITSKLAYLRELGIDIVWITPFYPGPGFDHGYDVSDYLGVDAQFGSLADFAELVAEAHRLDLKVFVDIVPNHSSIEHPWFRSAVGDVTSPYRDYYIFRPPAANGGPPNNWVSHFGGPAWSLDPGGSGEYYCHLFLPEQPDLNWDNPAVREEFRHILGTWCGRGVDGFRIDVAHGLIKDPQLSDNVQIRPITATMGPREVFDSFRHAHDLHRLETREIYRDWHALLQQSGTVLLGELDTRDLERFREFTADGDALDASFMLKLGTMDWEPATIVTDLFDFLRAGNGGAAWEVSNHDQPRAVSRFGGGEIGLRRTLAVTTLMIALDGITFIYQGEELGLPNGRVVGESHDPITTRNDGAPGRDVARAGMPWDDSHLNGFTSAPKAWLATAPEPAELTVAGQMNDPRSVWTRYRDMIGLRRRLPALWTAPIEVLARTETAVVIGRGNVTVIANLGGDAITLSDEVAVAGVLEFESWPGAYVATPGEVRIGREATVVLRRST